MIKDITLGQYFPGDSVMHRMDARVKLLLTAVGIALGFIIVSNFMILVKNVFLHSR